MTTARDPRRTDGSHARLADPPAAPALALGALLGGLAVAADVLPVGGQLLLMLASTGLSWGVAAALVGMWSAGPRRAAAHGAILLVSAVTSYYSLILLAGTRPSAGTSDVLAEGAAWLAVGLLGGPLLGAGGWYARHGTPASRSTARGALGGVLASQGVSATITTAAWAVDSPPGHAIRALAIPVVLVALPVVAVCWSSRRARPGRALVSLVAVATVGSLSWWVFDTALAPV